MCLLTIDTSITPDLQRDESVSNRELASPGNVLLCLYGITLGAPPTQTHVAGERCSMGSKRKRSVRPIRGLDTGFRSAQQCGAIQLSVIFEFLCLTSALITFMYTILNLTARFCDPLQNRLAGPAKGFGARTIPQSEGLGMG